MKPILKVKSDLQFQTGHFPLPEPRDNNDHHSSSLKRHPSTASFRHQSKGTYFPLSRYLINKLLPFFYRGIDYVMETRQSPSVKSSAIMALGLCFTFVGYEYSRAASITLLAAEVSCNGLHFSDYVSFFSGNRFWF
jgi:hypothetical protein